MKKTHIFYLLLLLITVTLLIYFYFNILNPKREWIKYKSSNEFNCDTTIYYDENSIKKRFLFLNEYQILIKTKGECLVNIYDDWGNIIGKETKSINENQMYYFNLKKNTYRYSHSPFEKELEYPYESFEEKIYINILKNYI